MGSCLKVNDDRASNGVTFEFFNPLNGEKFNSSICSEIKTKLAIPYKQKENLVLSKYLQNYRKNKNVDLYNPVSLGYYSRCVKSKHLDTSADISLSFKRNKMFQNQSIECSKTCSYEGLDENGYVNCDCNTSGEKEISNTGMNFTFEAIPSMNYDIFLCYYETFSVNLLVLFNRNVINYYI